MLADLPIAGRTDAFADLVSAPVPQDVRIDEIVSLLGLTAEGKYRVTSLRRAFVFDSPIWPMVLRLVDFDSPPTRSSPRLDPIDPEAWDASHAEMDISRSDLQVNPVDLAFQDAGEYDGFSEGSR
jgi:hypothetical protein